MKLRNAVLAGALAMATPAHADIVSFTSIPVFDAIPDLAETPSGSISAISGFGRFTLSQLWRIDQVKIVVDPSFPGAAGLAFFTDNGGLPGNLLTNIGIAPTFESLASGQKLAIMNIGLKLDAGNYWMAWASPSPSIVLPFFNNGDGTGRIGNGNAPFIAGATVSTESTFGFEVLGATPGVPEASTWVMIVAGFALLGLARQRKALSIVD